MTPLVDCAPIIINTPHLIAPLLNREHPGVALVVYMARNHSGHRISRAALRRVAGLDGKEPRFAASFEWLLLRINDTLPLTGWIIDEERERYRLEPISQRHHERLVRRYNARR
jgi:hypothetical protein